MSDYHILTADENSNEIRVVAHIPVPDIVNDVGVNYRDALVQWKDDTTSILHTDLITTAEQTQLDNGELYEHVASVSTPGTGMTLLEKRDMFDALYNDAVPRIQQKLANQLRYWGYSRDVA